MNKVEYNWNKSCFALLRWVLVAQDDRSTKQSKEMKVSQRDLMFVVLLVNYDYEVEQKIDKSNKAPVFNVFLCCSLVWTSGPELQV